MFFFCKGKRFLCIRQPAFIPGPRYSVAAVNDLFWALIVSLLCEYVYRGNNRGGWTQGRLSSAVTTKADVTEKSFKALHILAHSYSEQALNRPMTTQTVLIHCHDYISNPHCANVAKSSKASCNCFHFSLTTIRVFSPKQTKRIA